MQTLYRTLLGRVNSYRKIPISVTELYLRTRKYLSKNPVILEAGAHMGFDTYGLGCIWPKGTVCAFEPIPEIFNALTERISTLKNVKTYNIALGNENGSIEMYVSGGGSTASSSILKPTGHLTIFPSVKFDDRILVPVKKLNDWAKEENISVIDLLWLDMQGYEVYALEGANNLLQDVSVIYTELCQNELYSGLITQDDYVKFLKGKGFELVFLAGDDEVSEGIFINRQAIEKRKMR